MGRSNRPLTIRAIRCVLRDHTICQPCKAIGSKSTLLCVTSSIYTLQTTSVTNSASFDMKKKREDLLSSGMIDGDYLANDSRHELLVAIRRFIVR